MNKTAKVLSWINAILSVPFTVAQIIFSSFVFLSPGGPPESQNNNALLALLCCIYLILICIVAFVNVWQSSKGNGASTSTIGAVLCILYIGFWTFEATALFVVTLTHVAMLVLFAISALLQRHTTGTTTTTN